jgi:hypothetical protein
MSSVSLTSGGTDPPLRAGVALVLAVLVHLSAWQTLAGIRVLLPAREPPARTIEATLLPPAPTPIALPARRAVVRAAPAGHAGGSLDALTAVRTDRDATAGSKPRAPSRQGETPQPAAANQRAAAAAAAPASAVAPAAARGGEAAKTVASAGAASPVATPSAAAPPAAAPAAGAPPVPPSAAAAPPGAPAAAASTAGTPATSPSAAKDVATAAPTLPVETAPTPPVPAPAPPGSPAHAPVQVVLPKSARLVYASYGTVRAGGFRLGVRGRTTIRWQFQDGRYRSDLSIDIVDFKQSSQGRFDPDVGLEPERYSETRPRHPQSTTQFDWANHRVSFTDDAQSGTADPGAQDRLSIQFQLSVLRQVYPELFVRGTVVPITLAGTRDVSHWTFTVTGEDIVDSGLGHLPALRVLTTRTTGSGEESLEVWISERLDWFPARIRMVDKNRNVLDFVLDEATIG